MKYIKVKMHNLKDVYVKKKSIDMVEIIDDYNLVLYLRNTEKLKVYWKDNLELEQLLKQ